MSILFSASEVVTMAIEIERNGMIFYNSMAAKSDNEAATELFTFLAAEEIKHKGTFQKMLEGLKKIELSASDQEEYNSYLRALTSSRIFNKDVDMDEFVKDLDELAAINIAIEAEKDSILFYYELLDQSLAEDREDIERVIHEEKSHYARLTKLKNDLT